MFELMDKKDLTFLGQVFRAVFIFVFLCLGLSISIWLAGPYLF